MKNSTCRRRLAVALGLIAVLVPLGAAADEVTSKGTILRGKVTGFSAGGLTLEPEYGEGVLVIKWADLENVTTETEFQVFHGDDEENIGRLQGLSDGHLLVGHDPQNAARVEITTIHSALPLGGDGVSFADRMRSYWRYWDGNLDAGLNVQQSTTDTTGFLVAFRTLRTKDPTRLSIAAAYRYGTEKKKGEDSTRTQDQLYGAIREEYSFTPRVYGYVSGDATYDGIQRLSVRAIPKLGIGYVFWEEQLDETRRNFLQGDVGPSWVYEKYFGGDDDSYWAVAFGAQAGYYLPFGGAHLDWRLDYLPAVDNFTSDYLLRTALGLNIPVVGPLSARFGLLDEYDSSPAEDTQQNSLYLTFGLSLAW